MSSPSTGGRSRRSVTTLAIATGLAVVAVGATAATRAPADADADAASRGPRSGVVSTSEVEPAAFDITEARIERRGGDLVFTHRVRGHAGSVTPEPTGHFAGSEVLSYVWPTTLDPSEVGFAAESGILALAATSHPDFDDTPQEDEDRNGAADDDGAVWHAHWVVLVPDETRPDGALKVRDIAEAEAPDLPATWPGVPLYLDSPGYDTHAAGHTVRIVVPGHDVTTTAFGYDGVTAALRVHADLHAPLLRVEDVFDVASGDLSLPGEVR